MRKLFVTLTAAFALAACCGNGGKAGEQNTEAADGNVTAQTTPDVPKIIRLNVAVETTEGNLAAVIEGLNALAAASRAEEGCIGYEIFQSTVRPTSLIIVETWANDAALEAHQKTPHYTTILPTLDGKMTLSLDRFER